MTLLFLLLHLLLLALFLVFLATFISHACSFAAIITRDGEWLSAFGLANGVFKRKTILILLVPHRTESDRSTDAVVEVMWGALDPRVAPLETAGLGP